MDWLDLVLKISTLVGGVLAIVGGAIAIATFRRSAKLKRAEWLYNLYTRFYETQNYKEVRRILDYEPEPELTQLRKSVEPGANDKLAEDLVDYLNFFEFVASLWKLGQLCQREILMLFEYYLKRIQDHQFVVGFVRGQGFESLAELLEQIPRPRSEKGIDTRD